MKFCSNEANTDWQTWENSVCGKTLRHVPYTYTVVNCIGVNLILFVGADAVSCQRHLAFLILSSVPFSCFYCEWIMPMNAHSVIISYSLRGDRTVSKVGLHNDPSRASVLIFLLSGLFFVTTTIQFPVKSMLGHVEICCNIPELLYNISISFREGTRTFAPRCWLVLSCSIVKVKRSLQGSYRATR